MLPSVHLIGDFPIEVLDRREISLRCNNDVHGRPSTDVCVRYKTGPRICGGPFRCLWWRRRESNPRPLPCDGSALPTELRPQAERYSTKPAARVNNQFSTTAAEFSQRQLADPSRVYPEPGKGRPRPGEEQAPPIRQDATTTRRTAGPSPTIRRKRFRQNAGKGLEIGAISCKLSESFPALCRIMPNRAVTRRIPEQPAPDRSPDHRHGARPSGRDYAWASTTASKGRRPNAPSAPDADPSSEAPSAAAAGASS